jgi:hypothetical protein
MESLVLASSCSASPRLPVLSASAARLRGLPGAAPPPPASSTGGAARRAARRPRLLVAVAAAAAPRGSRNGERNTCGSLFRWFPLPPLIARCPVSCDRGALLTRVSLGALNTPCLLFTCETQWIVLLELEVALCILGPIFHNSYMNL